MKKIIKNFTGILSVISFILFIYLSIISVSIPNTFTIMSNDEFELKNYNFLYSNKSTEKTAKTGAEKDNKVNSEYSTEISLLGIIPIKNVEVSRIENVELVPSGEPFGIKMFTDGVMVVGMSDIYTSDGVFNPGKAAGIEKGDLIIKMNNQNVSTNEQVAQIISESNAQVIHAEIVRGENNFTADIQPVKDTSGTLKAGIWVRDSSAGIGTMTFRVADSGYFGGLGHGVCDVDTQELLPFLKGSFVDVNLTGVVKGQKGKPGELNGYFDSEKQGDLFHNSETGVYGEYIQPKKGEESIPLALKQEIHTGEAIIISSIDEEGPKEYKIKIEKVNYDEDNPTKNMMIKITDKELIEKTGGIVQGMSGSPILQDGKVVGAVTHVFVNDPEKGYGIFAENMVKECLTYGQKK